MTNGNESAAHTLGLRHWPFDLTPAFDADVPWADRADFRKSVDRLLRRLTRQDSNSLHLLWADFGAGKTHTLRYMHSRLSDNNGESDYEPIYAALPKAARSFVDIYRAVARSIDPSSLARAYEESISAHGATLTRRDLTTIWPEMFFAFHALARGSEAQQRIAVSWLRSEQGLRQADLTAVEIGGRIRTSDDAALALQAIVQLYLLAGRKRVLFLLDEFQRIETLRMTTQDDINAGLHSLYNACPRGLTIVLSFSFGVEANIRHFLNAELLSRADPVRLSLPAMSRDDGIEFLTDIVAGASLDGAEHPWRTPLYDHLVGRVEEVAKLTPRRLLKAAAHVFLEGSLDIEDGEIETIDDGYVNKVLTDEILQLVILDGEEEE